MQHTTSSDDWPILNHYTGENLHDVAFPLSGIGTGSISLGGRAELKDFELFNQPDKGLDPPYCFFALRTKIEGQPAATRVLEGVQGPPYSGAFGATPPGAGLPRMRNIALDAAYPFAAYTMSDPACPLTVRLEAFNPFIPLDVDRSSLPVAVLRYVLINPGPAPVEASLVGNLYNFIGHEAGGGPLISYGFRSLGHLLGGNVNDPRAATVAGPPLRGLLMRSENVKARTPQDGTLALAVLAADVTLKRSWGDTRWNRHLLTLWDDFSADGRLDDTTDPAPSPENSGQFGSLATSCTVPAGGEVALTFLITWHFPHRTAKACGWETVDPQGGWVGNYYGALYQDAWDVVERVAPQLPQLEADSLAFTRLFLSGNLPQAVKEAALNNASILRTQTCFRTADGGFFGFEGCADNQGCCFGSCTHVWNYEQTTAFLFPTLARSMRRAELGPGLAETGQNFFRIRLPLGQEPWRGAAADGQMGVIMKCYREWQLSGDTAWLADNWPSIRSLLEYAWLPGCWDADQDGVMEGIQHNTYDVEFYGPNPMMSVWYLGALRAGEEMAKGAGDEAFATRCRGLYERGSKWIEEQLYNGEYYIQKIQVPPSLAGTRPELRVGMGETDLADPDFQVGSGCLIDQLVGQYFAHVVGLGYLLDPGHIRSALAAIYRYNRPADFYNHVNVMRTFVINDERALLLCSWPQGGRPKIPFPYFSEVMIGFEYQAAAHMIYEGLVEEGLTVTADVRARFDGLRRNPWNEQECGHHYARSMAAWAVLLALEGFRYSGVTKTLELAPRSQPADFSGPWTMPSGWGGVVQNRRDGAQLIRWDVCVGELAVATMRYAVPAGAKLGTVVVEIDGQPQPATAGADGDAITITLARPVVVPAGGSLQVSIGLA
jgi:non-lysosomal glucosylceramidase